MDSIGVVGLGYVGSSLAHTFSKKFIIESYDLNKASTASSIKQLCSKTKIIFVCVPTPMRKDGSCDTTIVERVCREIDEHAHNHIVVIKSTIVPGTSERISKDLKNSSLLFNPEFLTEANSLQDFLNPNMQILGGKWRDCEWVERLYVRHSNVRVVPTFKVDLITASMLKYTINSWLATKVTFFNELKELYDASNTKVPWESFTDMLTRDPRIGDTHMQVPGPDGQPGFGGHCFPKDTQAFLYYAREMGVDLSVLDQAVAKNKKLRP